MCGGGGDQSNWPPLCVHELGGQYIITNRAIDRKRQRASGQGHLESWWHDSIWMGPALRCHTRSVIIIVPITTPLSNVLALMWRDVVWGWTKYNRQEMFFLIVPVGGAASDDNCGKNSHSTPSNLIHPQECCSFAFSSPPSLALPKRVCLFIYNSKHPIEGGTEEEFSKYFQKNWNRCLIGAPLSGGWGCHYDGGDEEVLLNVSIAFPVESKVL